MVPIITSFKGNLHTLLFFAACNQIDDLLIHAIENGYFGRVGFCLAKVIGKYSQIKFFSNRKLYFKLLRLKTQVVMVNDFLISKIYRDDVPVFYLTVP